MKTQRHAQVCRQRGDTGKATAELGSRASTRENLTPNEPSVLLPPAALAGQASSWTILAVMVVVMNTVMQAFQRPFGRYEDLGEGGRRRLSKKTLSCRTWCTTLVVFDDDRLIPKYFLRQSFNILRKHRYSCTGGTRSGKLEDFVKSFPAKDCESCARATSTLQIMQLQRLPHRLVCCD